MAIREKKVVAEVLVCDYCDTDIEDSTQGTHIIMQSKGYFKKDSHEVDLCVSCCESLGYKRRGRKPGSTNTKVTKAEAAPRVATVAAPAKQDDWDDE